MSKAQYTHGCQYGNHGEAFLWFGSGDDEVDMAIMYLVNLAKDNPRLAHEAADFVEACVLDAIQEGTVDNIMPPGGYSLSELMQRVKYG